jgi:DNA polymerase
MLRELNLYPMWVRRELPETAIVTETQLLAESEVVHVALPEVAVEEVQELLPVMAEATPVESVPEWQVVEVLPTEEQNNLLNIQYGMDHLSASYHQASEDSLREFQLKVAGGPLAEIDWPELKQKVRDCDLCKLRADCTQTVTGSGDENADWMFIGEAPGDAEDVSGDVFVGHAGRLLDNMLLAIKLKRENVYLANVIKCRPPEDRHPHVGEIASCLPYLKRQIGLVQPKLIVALGKTAASALLETDATIASLRGTLHDYKGIPLIVTYHPAYLLRSPQEKSRAWEDLCFSVATMGSVK